jgi:shikimate dehydrogenase
MPYRLGVIGNPIAHSLSPLMHNAAIAHLGLNSDYDYSRFLVTQEDLITTLGDFAAQGVVGLSVTIPHKEAVKDYLGERITPLARAVGAVNTLKLTPRGWEGDNTDVAGFIAPLQGMKQDWSQAVAVILGNGGAARAVVVGCHQLGFREILMVGRDSQKLAEFDTWKQTIDGNHRSPERRYTYSPQELPDLLNRTNLLVNTTPLGMGKLLDRNPLTDMGDLSNNTPVTEEELRKLIGKLPTNAIVYDLIYNPRPTKFLHLAAQRQLTAIDGIEMLVHQGAKAFEWWLDLPAPIHVMQKALLDHFGAINN